MSDLRTLCTELLDRLKQNVYYEEPAQDFDLDDALIERAENFLAETLSAVENESQSQQP